MEPYLAICVYNEGFGSLLWHPPLLFVSFLSLFAWCCLVLGPSTDFTFVLLPLVLTEGAAAAVFTTAPPGARRCCCRRSLCSRSPPLVLVDAAAVAVFAPAPPPLVLAEVAVAAVFALAPSAAGARRGCCRRRLYRRSSAVGARTGHAHWLRRFCGVFQGALQSRRPPMSSSCPRPPQSPHLDSRSPLPLPPRSAISWYHPCEEAPCQWLMCESRRHPFCSVLLECVSSHPRCFHHQTNCLCIIPSPLQFGPVTVAHSSASSASPPCSCLMRAHAQYASILVVFCVLVVLATPRITTLLTRCRCARWTYPLSAVVLVPCLNLRLLAVLRPCPRPTNVWITPQVPRPFHRLPCFLLVHSVLLVSSTHASSRSLSFYWACL